MDDLSKKKPVGSFPNEAAVLADLTANAVEWATEAAKKTKRDNEAALARCLASPGDVPTSDDVERIRHLFIRLAGRTKREPILRLLGSWQRLSDGAFDITPIAENPRGGHRDVWAAIEIWAKMQQLTGGDQVAPMAPLKVTQSNGAKVTRQKNKKKRPWDDDAQACAGAFIALVKEKAKLTLRDHCQEWSDNNRDNASFEVRSGKTLYIVLTQHRDRWDPKKKYCRKR